MFNLKKITPHNIVMLGTSGFPIGCAEVAKQKLIALSLKDVGCRVTIISHKAIHENKLLKIPVYGNEAGLDFIYTTGTPFKPNSKIIKKIVNFMGFIVEIGILVSKKYDFAIISTRDFIYILFYYFSSRIGCFKIFLTYVEETESTYYSANTILRKLNNYLFNRFVWHLVDGAFPISEYLKEKILKANAKLPIMKLPVLVDLASFENVSRENREKYFLFCGAASYFEIIEFILKAFNLLVDNEYKLFLVASGSKKDIQRLDDWILSSEKQHLIKRFEFLNYSELVKLYCNASALLIPLRNNIRDIARFPHKIGEYTASGRPIITTNFGEIPYYFKNKVNALIADQYSPDTYAEQMKFVIDNPDVIEKIGENGRILGSEYFNYSNYGFYILNFIKCI